jgi:kynurenine 3-monooxygenase
MQSNKTPITLIGAGLVGSLLAIYLARKGHRVELFEKRKDPRALFALGKVGEGRSINLAISARGLNALEQIGLKEKILEHAIPMTGRMMHGTDSALTYQAYGQSEKEAINSISRGWLNCFLLDEAEKMPGVTLHFDQRIENVDFEQKSFTLIENSTHKERKLFYDIIIGTDGSASAVRRALQKKIGMFHSEVELTHGYKEFLMPARSGEAPVSGPPASDSEFKMEKRALHIWPRGDFMMIALPNLDGSYTCTLFMRTVHAESSFEKLTTPEQVKVFFQTHFKDFYELVPDCVEQYFGHPTGKMVTLKCEPWHYKGQALLVGDAAHAIVPFFGQGMNAGFEDVVVLNKLLEEAMPWEEVFKQFFLHRKTNTDAIADMAVENLVEMSAKTADPHFLYQKKIEKILQERYPKDYRSRYSMVSFSLVPYRLAYEAGTLQADILEALTKEFYPDVNIDTEKAFAMIQKNLKPVMDKIDSVMKG